MYNEKIQKRAKALFDYLWELVNLGLKSSQTVEGHGGFKLYESEIPLGDGIDLVSSNYSEAAWLTVQGQEIGNCPEPLDEIRPWIIMPEEFGKEPRIVKSKVVNNQDEDFYLDKLRENHFHEYLDLWRLWASENNTKRVVHNIYDELFQVVDKLKYDVKFELVWGYGLLIWKVNGAEVKYPLITQRMFIEHKASEAIINVMADDDCEAQLEMDVLMGFGLKDVSEIRDKFNELDYKPNDKGVFKNLFKEISGRLATDGQIVDSASVKDLKVTGRLKIVNTWMLFIRKRKEDALVRNISDFREKLKSESVELPPAFSMFLSEACTRKNEQSEEICSDEWEALMDKDILFPLQANQEQIQIINRVSQSDGVVVLGPPGTGKSHTIANMICHFMAQGKRVLVTSQKDQALQVLHGLIPEELQPLCISVFSNVRDSKERLTFAVTKINELVSGANKRRIEQEVEIFENNLKKYADELKEAQRKMAELISLQSRKIMDLNSELSNPGDLIQKIKNMKDKLDWLTDSPQYKTSIETINGNEAIKFYINYPIDESLFDELKVLYIKLHNCLDDLSCCFPTIDKLPDIEKFRKMVDDLKKISILGDEINSLIKGVVFKDEEISSVDNAIIDIEKVLKIYELIKTDWQRSVMNALKDEVVDLKQFKKSIAKFDKIAKEVGKLLAEQDLDENVELGHLCSIDELKVIVDEVVVRVGQGKKTCALFASGSKKKILGAIRINNKPPITVDEWGKVNNYIDMVSKAEVLRNGWNNFVKKTGIIDDDLKMDESVVITEHEVQELIKLVEMVKAPLFYLKEKLPKLKEKLGKVIACVDDVVSEDSLHSLLKVFMIKRDLLDFQESNNLLNQLKDYLFEIKGSEKPHVIVADIIDCLNNVSVEPEKSVELWKLFLQRISWFESFESDYLLYKKHLDILKNGAPEWATRCLKGGMVPNELFPDFWRDSFFYNAVLQYLEKVIKGVKDIGRCEDKEKRLELFIKDTKRKLTIAKTRLGLVCNTSVEDLQALEEWRIAVKKLGKGKGKWAWKREKAVKFAMQKAKDAVPVWIMPVYKVSETLPAEFGCFDVVIVDEASQCDVRSLPILARGQKVIVVGDPEQISPEGVGIAENKIDMLISSHLKDIEHSAYFDVKTSLYDLAKIKFSGSGELMLKEHFRCVPEIIEFCNDLCYRGYIVPLRNPMAKERLEPVLDAVYVKNGRREDGIDVNKAEANKICETLQQIVKIPVYKGKTIGVISLTGSEQAKYISQIISKYLTPAERDACNFHVGDSYAFQGDERDVILLSMVVGSSDAKRYVALTRENFRQRFNVAVSRAKDKLIVFHSVRLGFDLKNSEDLRFMLLDYVLNNKDTQSEKKSVKTEELGWFKKSVYEKLTKSGYVVMPTSIIKDKGVDLVVEGGDNRIVIECVGGGDSLVYQWRSGEMKKRQLERAGWVFERVWENAFVNDEDAVMEQIYNKFNDVGIKVALSD